MKTIDRATWPRNSQYEFFRQLPSPHFNITSSVDVAVLVSRRKSEGISLFNAVLFAIMTAANTVPEFRMRFRGNTVVEHNMVHASPTIPIDNDRFAFCSIEYVPDWNMFDMRCTSALEMAKKQNLLVEHVGGTDEWIFLSCLPWINFTAMTNPNNGPDDCIPRITWGKIVGQNSSWMMPVSVQVHHALVDGIHVGKFYETLSKTIVTFEK